MYFDVCYLFKRSEQDVYYTGVQFSLNITVFVVEVTKDNSKLCTMGPATVFGELEATLILSVLVMPSLILYICLVHLVVNIQCTMMYVPSLNVVNK